MKAISGSKFIVIAIVSVLLLGGIALRVAPASAVQCVPAGSTGLTAAMVVTSHKTISGTTINATGCDVGIYIGPGATQVQITSSTVTGANEHGIFVQDASHISIQNDLVTGNGVAGHACPPTGAPPAGCIAEDKGIELVGTSDSIIANNVVSHNVADGGIGVADDGPLDPGAPNTHAGNPSNANNVVVKDNLILDNSNGCGIVIAAYNPSTSSGNKEGDAALANDNGNDNGGNGATVSGIQVTGNDVIGQAPAAGQLFPPHNAFIGQIVVATDGPNAAISNVQVANNNLDGAQLPGIVVHSNVFGDKISNTRITDNTIAESGYYPGPPATNPNDPGISQGTTGISLIAEVGAQPPGTADPILTHTTLDSNTVLGDVNGVWQCGTDHTTNNGLQGNPTNPTVVCHAGGS